MGWQLSANATDPAGMTLTELADLVRRAQAIGCDPASTVKATITMRGRVKSVSLVEPAPPASGEVSHWARTDTGKGVTS